MARLFGCHGSRRGAADGRVRDARLPRFRDHANVRMTPRETEIDEMSPFDGRQTLTEEREIFEIISNVIFARYI